MGPLRTMEFDEHSNAYVIRDTQSIVRALLHTQHPVAADGTTAREAAASYLQEHRALLGLDASELRSLGLRLDDSPADTGNGYRFVREKRQFDVTSVTFQLTHSGAPVQDAGISVHLKDAPVHSSDRHRRSRHFQVVCAQTTGHNAPFVRAAMPPPEALKNLRMLDVKTLAEQLGVADKEITFNIESLRITHQYPTIYRYESAKRGRDVPSKTDDDADHADPLAILLPPVPAEIVAGELYVVMAVYFDLTPKGHSPFHWLALVEVNTLSILYLEVFAGGINGMVFQADPITTHGGPPPSADNAHLNPRRVSVPLRGLASQRGGGVIELVGENVKVVNLRNPQILPPTIPPKPNFDFDVRTDDFAAVNAYYHCDRFFRLVEELGFKRDDYFPGTTFPTPVDHRGFNDPRKNGAEVFAQCKGTGDPVVGGIEFTQFCLAEVTMTSQIGNANDWRYVLHEFGGHGVLNNHVNSSYFGFAHSAGDSFAAILNDPESKAGDLGSTFPWTPAGGRRHDRTVKGGWGWDGQRDRNDRFAWQDREQILTTTHFHLYKSLGGGNRNQSPGRGNRGDDVDMRRDAAKFTIYLILRAIQTLTPVTNPKHASDWLCSMLVADAGDCHWTTASHSGGAYEKVIRWAFEKQGLFGGEPPDVDVYIDDGRHGGYQYKRDYSSCPAIWNRHSADGGKTHEVPRPNVVNFAYVKIKNRGRTKAASVVVDAFQNKPQSDMVYPDDWQPMMTPQLSAATISPNSQGVKVGPFKWIPSAGKNAILMAVSANGDRSNLHKFGSGRSIPEWRLVPHDNNLGLRKV